MALPITRFETAAPGALVKSALMNEIQDCIVGGKHGVLTRYLGFTEIVEVTFDRDAAWGPSNAPTWTIPTMDTYAWRFAAQLGNPGDQIYDVRLIALCTAATAGAFVAQWVKTRAAVGATVGGGFTGAFASVVGPVSSPATANTVLSIALTPGAPVLIDDDELHELQIDVPILAGDKVIYRVEIDYSRP